jgi:hypothetical protein
MVILCKEEGGEKICARKKATSQQHHKTFPIESAMEVEHLGPPRMARNVSIKGGIKRRPLLHIGPRHHMNWGNKIAAAARPRSFPKKKKLSYFRGGAGGVFEKYP